MSYRVQFPLPDLVSRLEEREKEILGNLVSDLKSYNTPSHAMLLASAPASPVKGNSKMFKMVSSSLVSASSDGIASRAFDDPSKWHGLPLSTPIDFAFPKFLFMMGERHLIIKGFPSKTRILKTFRFGPFIKEAVLKFPWTLLFLFCTRLARIRVVVLPDLYCPPT